MLRNHTFCLRAGLALSALGLVLTGAPDKARSATLTYNFSGTAAGVFGQALLLGLTSTTPFSGSFSYDTLAEFDLPPISGPTDARFSGAVTSIQFVMGPYQVSAPTGFILISDGSTDSFYARTNSSFGATVIGPSGGSVGDAYIRLQDNTSAAVPTDGAMTALPLLDFADFISLRDISVSWGTGIYRGSVTSLTLVEAAPNAVPLPPALALFVTGLAGMGWLARRRNKAA